MQKNSSRIARFSGNTKLDLRFPWRNTQRDQQCIGVPTVKHSIEVKKVTIGPIYPSHMQNQSTDSSKMKVVLLMDELHILGKTEMGQCVGPITFSLQLILMPSNVLYH